MLLSSRSTHKRTSDAFSRPTRCNQRLPDQGSLPIGRFRRRLAEAIQVQTQLAKADQEGVPLNPTKQRWIRNAPGAAKELKHVPLKVRRWWRKDDAGKTFLTLRSGSRLLEIAPGKKAIRIGEVSELPEKLRILCEAVMAGELDACAKNVLGRVPSKPKDKTATAAKPPSGGKEPAVKAH